MRLKMLNNGKLDFYHFYIDSWKWLINAKLVKGWLCAAIYRRRAHQRHAAALVAAVR
jgi:hypothetical protein